MPLYVSLPSNPHGLTGTSHTDYDRASLASVQTTSRDTRLENQAILTSGRSNFATCEITAGVVVSSITFYAATTPFTPGTNQHYGLWDSSRLRLAFTADDGVTAWSANTAKKLFVSRSVTDGVATSGLATITSATAAFTASDVGKNVTFMGAGAAGVPLGTSATPVTILSVDSGTQVTLSATAGTSVASGGTVYIATPYTVTTSALYYVSIMVAGTVPSLQAISYGNAVVPALAPIVTGQDATNTGQTTPASVTSPAAALTALTGKPYAILS